MIGRNLPAYQLVRVADLEPIPLPGAEAPLRYRIEVLEQMDPKGKFRVRVSRYETFRLQPTIALVVVTVGCTRSDAPRAADAANLRSRIAGRGVFETSDALFIFVGMRRKRGHPKLNEVSSLFVSGSRWTIECESIRHSTTTPSLRDPTLCACKPTRRETTTTSLRITVSTSQRLLSMPAGGSPRFGVPAPPLPSATDGKDSQGMGRKRT
jgi:hypothetical protein